MRWLSILCVGVLAAAVVGATGYPAAARTGEVATARRIHTQTIPCGIAANGTGVFAVTSEGSRSCAEAIRVANVYVKQAKVRPTKPFDIKVGAFAWECKNEKVGANSFTECIKRVTPTERVRITTS